MTRRPDDLPEEWHDTYNDEQHGWPYLLPWVVIATIAVWLVVAFIGFAVGRV